MESWSPASAPSHFSIKTNVVTVCVTCFMEKQEFSPKAHHFLRSVNVFNKPQVLWHLYRQKFDIFHFNIGPGSLACRRNDI